MGRAYDHQYLDASTSSCGEMKCGGCGRPIKVGQYRAYRRSKAHDWGFVTHHRACCADDAGWAKFDDERNAFTARNAAFLAEAVAFRDKWNIGDLDDLIDGLEVQAAKATADTTPPSEGGAS